MKTLAQLRTAVYQALGFTDPFANVATRTLSQLRTSLMAAMGYAATASSLPPGMATLLDEFINNAQDALFRRFELGNATATLPTRMTATSDSTTLDWVPVLAQATAYAKAHQGKGNEAKAYQDQVDRWVADIERRRPVNAPSVVTQAIQDAQADLYRRYPMLETERFFTWTLVDGQTSYAIDDDDAHVAAETLDPRKITWAGIEREDIWTPLTAGIPPESYSHNDWTGWPVRYEIRDTIELWPPPDATTQTLKIKGHFGLGAFTDDAHEATMDDHAIFLLATASCKEAYGQKDAQAYYGRLEAYIRGVVAGSHQTRRYIPGGRERVLYVTPVPTVPHA